MSTNGVSHQDADMAECDGEKVVTMMDVLQEEQDFEDDANAVLGASDEKNCTYSKGYIKRQAIYACLTCCTEAKDDPTKRAGVCLACSLSCHENHELVELYTKRNFRCDCGNPNFNSHPCNFTPFKTDLNEDNNYNQNFSGLYCTCHRPYPDPEADIEDEEMIQCIICEDWLHASHLEAAVPSLDQYAEMVCKGCMEKNEFLHDYSDLAVNIDNQDINVDVTEINGVETNLSNGNVDTEKLPNGTNDLALDTSVNSDNNMDLDNTSQVVDKPSIENIEDTEKSSTDIPIEQNKEKDPDVSMATESAGELSQNQEEVSNTECDNDLNTDAATEEVSQPIEETLEENKEVTENQPVATDNLISGDTQTGITSQNEPTEVNSEISETLPESQEHKESLPKEKNMTENNQESSEVKEGESQVQENVELNAEHKDEIENISEESKVGACDDSSKNLDEKQEEIIKAITDDQPQSEDKSKTISAENDNGINDSQKESPNTDNVMDKSDNINTDNPSSETVPSEENKEIQSEETQIMENNDNIKIPSEITTEEDANEAEKNTEESKEKKRKLSTEDATTDESFVKKQKLETCVRPKGVKRVHRGATFWPSSLRQKLCTCSECLSMYKDLSVLFLIDAEDTVFAYEAIGKERTGEATQYDKGLEALSSLDRIQQINALTEYNKMKDKLLDFLKSFKDRKEVVKEEDIKAFFAGMKPKREPDGVYFCR